MRAGRAVTAGAALIAAWDAYLLAVTAAAWLARGGAPIRGPRTTRFVVVVPARDEEARIGTCLASLRAQRYPAELLELVVVADGCVDRTADIARAHGARVVERPGGAPPGKGAVLTDALTVEVTGGSDAVVVVDADCVADPELLAALDERVAKGADAIQVDNRVVASGGTGRDALGTVGVALMNAVRTAGAATLGGSAGLRGTGMCFTQQALARVPWRAGEPSAEDFEYHAHLLEAGMRVAWEPRVAVRSPAATGGRRGTQRRRWDRGRLRVARRWGPRLLRGGVATGDRARVVGALDLLAPPQSTLAAGAILALGIGIATGRGALLRWSAAGLVCQAAQIAGGAKLTRTGEEAAHGALAVPGLLLARVSEQVSVVRDQARFGTHVR